MARKDRTPEEKARREKIRELLQMANIGSMDDIQNLFKETIAEFMENGLEAELEDELGYPGLREAERQRSAATTATKEESDWCGGAPNYGKFKGRTPEEVLVWLNID